MFKRIDIDNSGKIDYSEWIVATIDKNSLLTPNKLRMAFDMIDADGGGSISAEEIKEIICSNQEVDSKIWDDIINEVDEDKNGEIDFDEFCYLMNRFLKDN